MRDVGSTPKIEQELLQLGLGLKSAIKAEHVSAVEEAWLRERAARDGLEIVEDAEPLPSTEGSTAPIGRTLFCGPDRALLLKLRDWSHLQRDPRAASTAKHDAIRQIGQALGYPRCCVEHYIACREFPDQSLVFLRPAFGTEGVPNPLLNPSGNDELVSHVPCSYACEASIEIAERTAQALRQADATRWQARWLRMQEPVLVLGAQGHVRLTPAEADEARLDRAHFVRAVTSSVSDPELARAIARSDTLQLTPGSIRLLRGDALELVRARAAPLDLPILLRWAGAPRRRVKVALVDLHRSLVDYMDTMTLAMFSGDLTHLGVSNEVVRLYLDRDCPETWQRSLDALTAYLLKADFTAVVWNMTHDERVVRALASAGLPNVLVDARFGGEDTPFELVLANSNRQAFCRLWRELSEGRSVPRVPDLHYRHAAQTLGRTALVEPVEPKKRIDDASFWPNTSYVTLEGEHRPDSDVWHLCANPGCPYGKSLDDNPHFADVVVPESASLRGCSFCEEGGDYEGAPAEPTLKSLLYQLEYVAKRSPHARFILLERAVFRFLPIFLRRADELLKKGDRNREPVEFFVTARTDEMVRERDRLREALRVAEELGQRVNLYLVGIENFAQSQLDLFNKGTTVEQHVRACEIMREMEQEFVCSFTTTRNAAHGFLLFTPWTTLADLEQNAEMMLRTRIWEIRSEATLSKLRLYPTVPLYYKAQKDGLLTKSYDDARLDSSERLGYSKETPWRFAHPESEAVYRLLLGLVDDYPRGSREVELLRAAIAEVKERGADVSPVAFAERWRARHRARRGLGRMTRAPLALTLSNRCNLGCTFCNRKSPEAPPERRSLAQTLLDGRARGHDHVLLGGAEPLMSPDLLWTAKAARAAGYATVALETNTIGLDAERIRRLSEAGVTRLMPFLPAWSLEVISQLAREPEAGRAVASAAPFVDGSGLELLPVVAVARETLQELERFAELVHELYPHAGGIALRFFPDGRRMPGQGAALQRALERLVDAADAAGLRVYPAGEPIPPPCAYDTLSHLRDLAVLDGAAADAVRIAECAGCALAPRCAGVSSSFRGAMPDAELSRVRTPLPTR